MDNQEYGRHIGGPTSSERDQITREAVEVERQRREDELLYIQERSPRPGPPLNYANNPAAQDAAFPPQVVTKIRDHYEPVREFTTPSPEEMRLANALARIDALERRVTLLEAGRNGGA